MYHTCRSPSSAFVLCAIFTPAGILLSSRVGVGGGRGAAGGRGAGAGCAPNPNWQPIVAKGRSSRIIHTAGVTRVVVMFILPPLATIRISLSRPACNNERKSQIVPFTGAHYEGSKEKEILHATANSLAALMTATSTGIIRSRSRSVSAVTTIAMTTLPRMSAG